MKERSDKISFISIDPSLSNTAVVIGEINEDNTITLIDYVLVQTEKTKVKSVRSSSDTIRRCREILEVVKGVVLGVNPSIAFVETPSGSQSYSGALSYGISCAIIASVSPPPVEVTPTEVKVATVGTKTASKKEIMAYCGEKYPYFSFERKRDGSMIEGKMEHVCDAICIAEAGIKTREYQQLSKILKSK